MVVDGVATNRLLTKLRLTAVCHRVTAHSSGGQAVAALRADLPDLVLIGSTLPDMTTEDLCRMIRTLPGCRALPVIMQVETGQRLAALSAGATAIIEPKGDDQTLFARIRGVMRGRVSAMSDDPPAMPGLAEPAAPYGSQPATRIMQVCGQTPPSLAWRHGLQLELGQNITVCDPERALAQAQTAAAPDLYLIWADIRQDGDGLRLLSELRSRRGSRNAAFLVVLHPGRPDMTPVALDLGAGDVLTGAFASPAAVSEAALRIRKQLEDKRIADRQRREAQRNLIWAMHDPLTGLHNRRHAIPRLDQMLHAARQSDQAVAVILLDIDHFKAVNDDHGHPAGDMILQAVAKRLQQAMPPGGILARYGGEEFLAALPLSGHAAAHALAERLRSAIAAQPFPLPGHPQGLAVTISLGLAVVGPHMLGALPLGPDRLMARADNALLTAKTQGRNRVVIAQPDAAA